MFCNMIHNLAFFKDCLNSPFAEAETDTKFHYASERE